MIKSWDNPSSCSELLAHLVTTALIDEMELTPKPGLVDLNNSGAHKDLNIAMMRNSAYALQDRFAAMAIIAYQRQPSQQLREQLAAIGREAERIMMVATQGVNTHRGAIWALGLLTAGAAICPPYSSSSAIAAKAAAIAQHTDRFTPPMPDSNGTKVIQRYSVSGARGEAQNGFPHVIDVALPILKSAIGRGIPKLNAQIDALLAIMTTLEDTCVLHRGGHEALKWVQQTSSHILAVGGTASREGWEQLQEFDFALINRRVSPGGSADLLAATLFLDSIEKFANAVQP